MRRVKYNFDLIDFLPDRDHLGPYGKLYGRMTYLSKNKHDVNQYEEWDLIGKVTEKQYKQTNDFKKWNTHDFTTGFVCICGEKDKVNTLWLHKNRLTKNRVMLCERCYDKLAMDYENYSITHYL